MSTNKGNKALLTEMVRKDVISYLNFIGQVYPDAIQIDSDIAGIKYKLKKDNPEGITKKDKADTAKVASIQELEKLVSECKKCELHKTRKNVVFGKGSDKEKLVIIGEAPGAEEDQTGEPFVGRAGQLLTKMLSAIDINRDDIYICNVLKCRPPGNRDPLPDEITMCSNYLDMQLEFLKPRYILALGRIAAMRLLGKQSTMKEFREGDHSYKGVPVLVTYHPSALLRNPNWKYPAWEDLKRLKELLDEKNG
ncbi:MAG: uracil-DNA glycosylase [Candidatus Delongbacteria bacterium]|jgi:DNA polymerase|nr:uracil-DNA glycosylase [Candidatus Delongbacteria bacterium]MDY0017461.1 uracil-DNA glycosylase [Candidatus Delongbacteria bacterium]